RYQRNLKSYENPINSLPNKCAKSFYHYYGKPHTQGFITSFVTFSMLFLSPYNQFVGQPSDGAEIIILK
ncbi:hypothetical protein L9F63_009778, partial [Diploptera punctata]